MRTFIAKSILNPINHIKGIITNIGNKNLDFDIDEKEYFREDEIGDIVKASYNTRESLRATLKEINNQGTMINESSNNLSNTASILFDSMNTLSQQSKQIKDMTDQSSQNSQTNRSCL
jgi:methyl-accepting chemotaxis protein